MFRTRDTVVREYRTRRQMQRGVDQMACRGYRVAHQSGKFSHNPFAFRWNRDTVVVTFRRDEAPPPALG